MFKDKKFLALIGARGGSKGLPRKNVLDCAGKPLISWTIEAGLQSQYVDDVVVSTDCKEIQDISKEAGAFVPFLRPVELATDEAKSSSFILHALNWLETNENKQYDYILLLQPTSPLRTSAHIDQAIEQYFKDRTSDEDTLVSAYKVPSKYNWIMKKVGPHVQFCFGDLIASRRQELGDLYLPNGALFMAPVVNFSGDFYTEKTLFFEMSEKDSIDIDTGADFEEVSSILRSR